MGCCGKADIDPDAHFAPQISEKRKCTDCLFLIIFLFFWAGMLVIAVLGFQHGSPEKLLYAIDYQGNTCGGSADACDGPCADVKKAVYPRMTEDLYSALQSGEKNPMNVEFFGVCTAACPRVGDWVCDYEGLALLKKFNKGQGLTEAEIKNKIIMTPGVAIGAPIKGQPVRPIKRSKALRRLEKCQSKVPAGGGRMAGLAPWKFMGRGASRCWSLMQHCWPTPQNTKDFFSRCLPLNNETSTTVERCVRPRGLQATDPGCRLKRVTVIQETEQPGQENVLVKQLQGKAMVLSRYFADLQKSKMIVLGIGAGFALVMGFVWIGLLRFAASIMVWVTVWLVVALMVVFTMYLYSKAGKLTPATVQQLASQAGAEAASAKEIPAWASAEANAENLRMYEIAAYIATALTVIQFLMTIFLRSKINVAIGIIKEASKAIGAMPSIVFFPLFTFTCVLLLSVYWLIVAAYLQSSSTISAGSIVSLAGNSTFAQAAVDAASSAAAAAAAAASNITITIPDSFANATGLNATDVNELSALARVSEMDVLKWMQLYHFFGLLWTNQFIQAIGVTTIAGAVCSWYWVMDKDDTPRFAVAKAFKRTMCYHLGSIAFGSFIVAVIQLMRFILAYLDKKSKDLQDRNKIIKLMFKLVACCLWCFEKCVKFINKNAFIIVAMMGWPFCKSTKNAVKLIMSNVAQIGTTNMIGTFMMYMGKFCIALICGIVAFICLDKMPQFSEGENKLESTMFPVLLTTLLAYFVATAFLEVYDMAIDTILICFCMDREHNDGSRDKPYFMSDTLRKFVNTPEETPSKRKKKKKKKDKNNNGDGMI